MITKMVQAKEESQSNNKQEATGQVPKTKTPAEMTEGQILKNVVLISFSFLILFTSYGGLAALQSSLHIQEGMGVITQSILYGIMTISCLFLPKPAIHFVGHKWTFIFSMIGYVLWMAANGYAVWGTMITASILVGICASTLWTAQCAYFTIVAEKYAAMRNETYSAVNARFFGIFFAIFRLNGAVSAIIQTTVLQQGQPDNYTGPSDEEIQLCGLNDCPGNNMTNENFDKPPSNVIWTLVGIYIGISILGFIMASIFIDKLPEAWLPVHEKKKDAGVSSPFQLLGATVRHMRHINQLLLIPLTIFSGLEQTFYGSEFNKSYITCNLGMWLISLITLPSSVVNAIIAFSSGRLVKLIGTLPIFITAMLVEISLHLILLFWKPHPDQVFMFILIPMLQGITDGVWQAQINALYGTLFPSESEAAFSNYRLWESLGYIMAFAWSSYLCTSVKLYLTMSFFYLGACLLFVLYGREKLKTMNQPDECTRM